MRVKSSGEDRKTPFLFMEDFDPPFLGNRALLSSSDLPSQLNCENSHPAKWLNEINLGTSCSCVSNFSEEEAGKDNTYEVNAHMLKFERTSDSSYDPAERIHPKPRGRIDAMILASALCSLEMRRFFIIEFSKLVELPARILLCKLDASLQIKQFNRTAIAMIKSVITKYINFIMEAAHLDLKRQSIFLKHYLLVSEYDPLHYLVLRNWHYEKSTSKLVKKVVRCLSKTFNDTFFVVEIIGAWILLRIVRRSGTRVAQSALHYQANLGDLTTSQSKLSFADNLAMFVKLALLEFCEWLPNG